MPGSPADEFHVHFPASELQKAREWALTFLGGQFQEQATIALRSAYEQLKRAPLEWGEPTFDPTTGNVIECKQVAFPFHFTYRVDVNHRYVYVKNIEPVPGASGQPGS
jgi:hypothetical protein